MHFTVFIFPWFIFPFLLNLCASFLGVFLLPWSACLPSSLSGYLTYRCTNRTIWIWMKLGSAVCRHRAHFVRLIGTRAWRHTQAQRLVYGRRTVVERPADGRRRRLCRQRRRKKQSFDRGGPVWPPRSNAKYDRLGGWIWGVLPPQLNPGGLGGSTPQPKAKKSENISRKKVFFIFPGPGSQAWVLINVTLSICGCRSWLDGKLGPLWHWWWLPEPLGLRAS